MLAAKAGGARSSTISSRGVGYSTENSSIEASHPQSRKFFRMYSAFARSCALPT